MGLSGESRGLVPTKDWHRKHSPEGFQHGFTLSTSVGQGDTRVTPLQLALAYGMLANGGTLHYPRIVDHVTNTNGEVLFHYPARVRRRLDVTDETLAQIGIGMTAVVNEPHGTVYNDRLNYITIAGKTGTAQVRGFARQRLVNGEVVLRHRDHSWFVGYGPVENPEIVVVAFVEHGGAGSKVAAPVAMKVIDRYFQEIRNIDPEAARALARAQPSGPRRLARPQLENPPRWVRPGRGANARPGGRFLLGTVEGTPDEKPKRRLGSPEEKDPETTAPNTPEESSPQAPPAPENPSPTEPSEPTEPSKEAPEVPKEEVVPPPSRAPGEDKEEKRP